MISQWSKVESQGDHPRYFAKYAKKHPTQRESQGAACCRPEELKEPSMASLFIGSQDD